MGEDSKLAIIGGIIINCDDASSDRFLPLKLEIRGLNFSENVFEQAFGKSLSTQGYSLWFESWIKKDIYF